MPQNNSNPPKGVKPENLKARHTANVPERGFIMEAVKNPSNPLGFRAATAPDRQRVFDDDMKKEFLRMIAEFPSVLAACRALNISITAVHRAKLIDDDFAAAWNVAIDIGYDILEAEALRRAVLGVEEPVYDKGRIVGYVTKYSDSLLAFLLKGRRRQIYGERSSDASEDKDITIRVIGGLPDA